MALQNQLLPRGGGQGNLWRRDSIQSGESKDPKVGRGQDSEKRTEGPWLPENHRDLGMERNSGSSGTQGEVWTGV